MTKLTKDDLTQMNRGYFKKLETDTLVDVACRLRDFSVNLVERLEQNSKNSSKPPSSDNPYNKGKNKDSDTNEADENTPEDNEDKSGENNVLDSNSDSSQNNSQRSPGKQPGAQGFWRTETPVPESTVPHYPESCAACGNGEDLCLSDKPHMGFYTYDLEKTVSGIRIFCNLNHYHSAVCKCGHETKAKPGEGYVSHVEGRKNDLKLSEYTLVGPMFVAFLIALSVRCRMSRLKIREFLCYWLSTELATGTIDKCIREGGVACFPVVEELLEELQEADLVHLDETPWYEKGIFKWLWVAISDRIAIFRIGSRKKEELLQLITTAFTGWLVSDGYMAYRSYEKRQRCLAHLIRKAIALTGAVDGKAQKMGDWFLRELRGLIKAMTEDGEGASKCNLILARLKKACNLGSEEDHEKLKALSKEILNDWDAVVAFVKNPELPPTNNDAERALRHAVISRRISFGTRTTEGSQTYAALLSVIETCRLRKQDPWQYIADTVALGRKGLAPLSIKA